MNRNSSLLQILVLVPILICLCPLSAGKCYFDNIQLPTESLTHTSLRYNNQVHARDVDARCHNAAWKPIRIHTHFGPLTVLSNHDKFRLHTVVKRAVQRIKSLLSVKSVFGLLFLSRSKACGSVHSTGPNKGKCANIRPNYHAEFCANKVDNFQIPNEHLQGIDVYDENGTSPVSEKSLANGEGVIADYILYVTAVHSDLCISKDIVAYASYCQLDQNDRPVAGLVNFCPEHLKTALFSHSKAMLAVVHEVFHALGFSSELFSKYKECSARGHCFKWKRVVTEDDGPSRVVLPSVVAQMQKHFNCTQDELGAPLEITDGNSLGSHWDPLVLHYSIMSPHISESHLMAIDPITLAAFDDMGWYWVNHSSVDIYDWASGAGCEFVNSPQCTADACPSFLCDLRKNDNTSGCDYHHTSVSLCAPASKRYDNIGVYKPLSQGQCESRQLQLKEDQACFVSSIYGKKEGQCLQYRCLEKEIEVLVDGQWIPCPNEPNSVIEGSKQTVVCPVNNFQCKKAANNADDHQFLDFSGGVALWIKITSPTPSSVNAMNGSEEMVKMGAIDELQKTTGLPTSWINRTFLLSQEQYILGLLLVPPPETSKEDTDTIYSKIHRVTENQGLNYSYLTAGQARRRIPISEPPWPFRNLKGVYILLFMLGVVFIVVIVSAVGATVIQVAVGRPMVVRSRIRREFVPVPHS